MCAFNLKAVVSAVQKILQLFFPFKCCLSDFSFLILELLLDLYLCSVALAFLFMFLICFLSVLLSVWILSSSLQSPVFSCVHGLGLWSPAWPASLLSPHLSSHPRPQQQLLAGREAPGPGRKSHGLHSSLEFILVFWIFNLNDSPPPRLKFIIGPLSFPFVLDAYLPDLSCSILFLKKKVLFCYLFGDFTHI